MGILARSPILCHKSNKFLNIFFIIEFYRNVWLLCRFIWRRIPGSRNRVRILHECRIDGQCNGNGRNVLLRPVLQHVRKCGSCGSVNTRFPGIAICSRTSHAESELPVRGIRTIAIFKFSVLLVPFSSFRFCVEFFYHTTHQKQEVVVVFKLFSTTGLKDISVVTCTRKTLNNIGSN